MTIRVAGRYGFARPPMVKIFSQTLAAAGKFDVTGIPPSFRHLMILTHLRSDVAATIDLLDIFLNGDTTSANYLHAAHTGGTAHTSSQVDTPQVLTCPAGSSPANYFQSGRCWVMNYTEAFNKTFLVNALRRQDATTIIYEDRMFQWENTAIVNQITIQIDNDPTDELVAGSRLDIYGVY